MDEYTFSVEPADTIPQSRSLGVTAIILFCLIALTAGAALGVKFANMPPSDFPSTTPVVISEGQGVSGMAAVLAEKKVIRSESFFKLAIALRRASASLRAGTYRFTSPLTTEEVVEALILGKYSNESVTLTIPEGTNVEGIALAVHAAFPHIATSTFLTAALPHEGYLFPDTYSLSPKATTADIITQLQKTFAVRASPLLPTDALSATQTVIMASILEREGKTEESMSIISGILWKRLAAHMPLQVDATLEYERGKGSAALTIFDLQKDSPFNTYTRVGLPPTPIANPGLAALRAALHPTKTEYWFYLTGSDGTFHYAKTFDDHKQNKVRYLRP